MAKTPLHAFRIPHDLYFAALAKAKTEGDNLSEIVRAALIEYVGDDYDEDPPT